MQQHKTRDKIRHQIVAVNPDLYHGRIHVWSESAPAPLLTDKSSKFSLFQVIFGLFWGYISHPTPPPPFGSRPPFYMSWIRPCLPHSNGSFIYKIKILSSKQVPTLAHTNSYSALQILLLPSHGCLVELSLEASYHHHHTRCSRPGFKGAVAAVKP